ncbi:MAG: AbrB/MazE/SpoVT family DNA-binding domain-containing protein [Candidatus Aenigmarchaeota archaeon]|nr:AbrB/MazE/SpoVT family DNA-binding domain-containing protein [Candidatus Aenigmarchaeota archaeon]
MTSSTYTLSSIDKKGRVFIPVKLRFKLRFLEGTNVRLSVDNGRLIVEKEGSE